MHRKLSMHIPFWHKKLCMYILMLDCDRCLLYKATLFLNPYLFLDPSVHKHSRKSFCFIQKPQLWFCFILNFIFLTGKLQNSREKVRASKSIISIASVQNTVLTKLFWIKKRLSKITVALGSFGWLADPLANGRSSTRPCSDSNPIECLVNSSFTLLLCKLLYRPELQWKRKGKTLKTKIS